MVNNSVDQHITNLIQLLNGSIILQEKVIGCLQKLTALMRTPDTRSDLKIEQWNPVVLLSKEGRLILTKSDQSPIELSLLIELLRFIRNSCGGLCENQSFVLNNSDLLNFAKEALSYFLPKEDPNEVTVLKIAIQLFGNILVSNELSKPVVWSLFYGENIFRHLLQHRDMSIRECTMMVLFNCMSDENSACIINTVEGHEILLRVSETLLYSQIDWGVLFIEHLLTKEDFLDRCYGILPLKNRLLILDIMEERLKTAQDDCYFSIPGSLVESIKNLFLRNITQISRIKDSDIEPSETVLMLSILCSASISDAYVSFVQNSKDLVQTSVEVLKCIHLLGKEGCNVFSAMSDIGQLSAQVREEIAHHPLYGFKKSLIRLIGNICCNCKDNQDLVRRLDGIPLILDCCKFDAKNPYIMQWCILAIRNLLTNNPENQAIVASISASGEIADSKILSEMGLQICSENGKIHLKSTPPTF